MKRRLLIVFACLLLFIFVAFRLPFFPLFALSLPIDMTSMEPLLSGNDIAIANRYAYGDKAPAIGDVIVFYGPIKDTIYPGVVTQCGEGVDQGAGLYAEWFANAPHVGFICVKHANESAPIHPGLSVVPLALVKGKIISIVWPLEYIGGLRSTESKQ